MDKDSATPPLHSKSKVVHSSEEARWALLPGGENIWFPLHHNPHIDESDSLTKDERSELTKDFIAGSFAGMAATGLFGLRLLVLLCVQRVYFIIL